MQEILAQRDDEEAIAVLSPTLDRARAAIDFLRRRLRQPAWTAASLGRLPGLSCRCLLLCPEGLAGPDDLAFLQRVRHRVFWPLAEGDLAAAIGGLRGDSSVPRWNAGEAAPPSDLKTALLLEGRVTVERARAALVSPARHWIVQSAFAVAMSDRQLSQLAREGVRWSTLEPVRVHALLASPRLARERPKWRGLLPPRTRVIVWPRGA